MTIRQAIYEHITEDADVSALIGTRCYPGVAPESAALPYVVYQTISTARPRHLGGTSGIAERRIQLDVYAATLTSAESVSEELRELFSAFRGAMGSSAQVNIRSCFVDDEDDLYEEPVDSGGIESGVFRVRLDIVLGHLEDAISVP